MSDKALWVRAFLKCGVNHIFCLILKALISKLCPHLLMPYPIQNFLLLFFGKKITNFKGRKTLILI
jgi:hypothetical protein